MAGMTLQQELQQLKARVQAISMSRSEIGTLINNRSNDRIVPRLSVVNHAVNSVSQNFPGFVPHPSLDSASSKPPSNTPPQQIQGASPAVPTPQNQFTLPSGPLFWQLFTSLRTDVRDLNHRMTSAEQDISDLEDRVDRMEPAQLTPVSDTIFTSQLPEMQPATIFEPFLQNSGDVLHTRTNSGPGQDTDKHAKIPGQPYDWWHEKASDSRGPWFPCPSLPEHSPDRLPENSSQPILQNLGQLGHDKLPQPRNVVDAFQPQRQAYELYDMRDPCERMDAEIRKVCVDIELLKSHVKSLQDAVYESHRKNRTIANQDARIKEFLALCEQKDKLLEQREERVIQNAKLVELREDELKVVYRKLGRVHSDYEYERRERSKLARLLEEREDEIKRLRDRHSPSFARHVTVESEYSSASSSPSFRDTRPSIRAQSNRANHLVESIDTESTKKKLGMGPELDKRYTLYTDLDSNSTDRNSPSMQTSYPASETEPEANPKRSDTTQESQERSGYKDSQHDPSGTSAATRNPDLSPFPLNPFSYSAAIPGNETRPDHGFSSARYLPPSLPPPTAPDQSLPRYQPLSLPLPPAPEWSSPRYQPSPLPLPQVPEWSLPRFQPPPAPAWSLPRFQLPPLPLPPAPEQSLPRFQPPLPAPGHPLPFFYKPTAHTLPAT